MCCPGENATGVGSYRRAPAGGGGSPPRPAAARTDGDMGTGHRQKEAGRYVTDIKGRGRNAPACLHGENLPLGGRFPKAYSFAYGIKTPFDLLALACGLATAVNHKSKGGHYG